MTFSMLSSFGSIPSVPVPAEGGACGRKLRVNGISAHELRLEVMVALSMKRAGVEGGEPVIADLAMVLQVVQSVCRIKYSVASVLSNVTAGTSVKGRLPLTKTKCPEFTLLYRLALLNAKTWP